MLLNSWPFRFLITRAARAYGFMDPLSLLGKLRKFAQPSEFAEPIELLRAGMLFHARGLINTKAIQNNLDWIWPYWVERQFNPADESFIPRAFSFSHINLTHRNWTGLGLPDVPFYPIVDPRGLVTPLFDGWSLDVWLLPESGQPLFPSKLPNFQQTYSVDQTLHVRSVASQGDDCFETDVTLELIGGEPHCQLRVQPGKNATGQVVVALRPYNPEGVSFVERIEVQTDRQGWIVNDRHFVAFDRLPSRHLLSHYQDGDVSHRLHEEGGKLSERCPVAMATAAAFFPVNAVREKPLIVRAPIFDELDPKKRPKFASLPSWGEALSPLARLRVPEKRIQNLYDQAVASLVLHSPDEVYPGPFTYKRFWFRDAAFILHVLLALGGVDRTRRALKRFHPRQRRDGYFLSQEGEWDSNGEVLWMYHRYAELTGEKLPTEWLKAVAQGARWIVKKRLPMGTGRPEAGLLPAGFSAEHLGPNDFYYWDDFWGVAGLRCAAQLLQEADPPLAASCAREADQFLATIEQSFPRGPHRRFPGAIPASPKRRMDSGAIGSIVADYPLQLFPPGDERIMKTVAYLCDHSTHNGGFFQNMIHSGINCYLTIHLAQVYLRSGDSRAAWKLIDRVADLASPTGQWPEAVHPRTGGGCMGDGHHIWASAEWAMMIRNCFLREEAGKLILGAGVRAEWLHTLGEVLFGPTLTPYGSVTFRLNGAAGGARGIVEATWRTPPPLVEVRIPGFEPRTIQSIGERTEFQLTALP